MKLEVLSLVRGVALALGGFGLASSPMAAQSSGEMFTATASMKSEAASATAPVKISVTHFATDAERSSVMSALKTGGTPAMRQVLAGMKDAGSIEVGQRSTPIKYAYARPTGPGRLVTIVTAQPIIFLGAGLPEAKPKAGYDVAIALLVLEGNDSGHGELAPAAKVKINESGAVVVDDYGADKVWLKDVARTK
jgi:hypothetical protein